MSVSTSRLCKTSWPTGKDTKQLINLLHSSNNWIHDFSKWTRRRELNEDAFKSGLNTVLLHACQLGLYDILKHFIEQHRDKFDINAAIKPRILKKKLKFKPLVPLTPSGMTKTYTLLHQAAECGHYDIAELLIQSGASVNSLDCCGDTPLYASLKACSLQALEKIMLLLIRNGTNVNHCNCNSMTPLMHAVHYGDHSAFMIRILLEAKADMYVTDNHGFTALHHAALANNSKAVKELIQTYGMSPLFDSSPSPVHLCRIEVNTLDIQCLLDPSRPNAATVLKVLLSHSQCPATLQGIFLAILAYQSAKFSYTQLPGFRTIAIEQKMIEYAQKNFPSDIFASSGIITTEEELTALWHENDQSFFTQCENQSLLLSQRLLQDNGNTTFIDQLLSIALRKIERSTVTEDVLLYLKQASELILEVATKSQWMLVYSKNQLLKWIKQCMTGIHFANTSYLNEELCFSLEEHIVRNSIDSICTLNHRVTSLGRHSHDNDDTDQLTIIYNSVLGVIERWVRRNRLQKPCRQIIRQFLCQCPHSLHQQKTSDDSYIFSLAIHISHSFIEPLKVIGALLENGGDHLVNSFSSQYKQRPLITAMSYQTSSFGSQLISMLLDAGAHIDVVDTEGNTPETLCKASAVSDVLECNIPRSLYCLTARAVVKHNIPFTLYSLPSHVVYFISLHNPKWKY